MSTGKRYPIDEVWREEQNAGFTFSENVDPQEFACETGTYPKRPLRLGLQFPVRANTLSQSSDAIVENLSQQGARLDSDAKYAINQNVRIEGFEVAEVFGEVRAKVRWRDETRCGVVFDDTLTLE